MYRVLSGKSVAELEKAVNSCIRRGYLPQGGVAVDLDEGVFYQAMLQQEVKEEKMVLSACNEDQYDDSFERDW